MATLRRLDVALAGDRGQVWRSGDRETSDADTGLLVPQRRLEPCPPISTRLRRPGLLLTAHGSTKDTCLLLLGRRCGLQAGTARAKIRECAKKKRDQSYALLDGERKASTH